MHFGCCRGRCWCSGGATLSPRWQHRLLPLQQTQNLYRDQDRAWGSLSNPCLARGKKNGGLRWIFYLGAHSCSYELTKLCSCSHTCPTPNFFDLSPKTDNSPTGMAAVAC